MGDLVVNAVLALLLVVLAWRLLVLPDLFGAGVLFIVFGLLAATVWLRLGAVDVALAEAALGAGVTGALFLNTLAGIREHPTEAPASTERAPGLLRWAVTALAGVLTLALVALVLQLAAGPAPPSPAPPPTGKLTNPVTAVLLDVRGYDTLLEMVVLWLALVGALAMGRAFRPDTTPPPALLAALARLLVPIMVVVAAALLWSGASEAGGAFQSGAVLAAAGILLRLADQPLPLLDRFRLPLATVGPAVFLAVALGTLLAGRGFLDYPAATRPWLVLGIEAAVAVAVATILVSLFDAVGPGPNRDRS